MTVTIFITTGLKWSITTGIFGSVCAQVADSFKETKPFTCMAMAFIGLILITISIWTFLDWLWSI